MLTVDPVCGCPITPLDRQREIGHIDADLRRLTERRRRPLSALECEWHAALLARRAELLKEMAS